MATRCKMKLSAVVAQQWGGAKAIFHCEYDPNNKDDKAFAKATPSGFAEFVIDNPAALSSLVIGKCYYFDIVEVE